MPTLWDNQEEALKLTSEKNILDENISFYENEVYYWINCAIVERHTSRYRYGNSDYVYTKTIEKRSYNAMSNMSFKVVETYFEHKIDNYTSEIRGNKDICHNFLTIRYFNPNKNK